MAVDKIKALGRYSIIQSAAQLIDEPSFSVANFDRVKVLTNANTVFVSFQSSVRYVPINSSSYYGVGVDLVEEMSSYEPLSNPSSADTPNHSFFLASEEDKRNMDWVLEISGKPHEHEVITIYEMEGYYLVNKDGETYDASFKLDKETKEIYEERSGHLVPPPNMEGDKLQELK